MGGDIEQYGLDARWVGVGACLFTLCDLLLPAKHWYIEPLHCNIFFDMRQYPNVF